MRKTALAAIILAAISPCVAATPVTITFEDVTAPGPIGDFYAGLGVHFDGAWHLLQGTGTYPAHSGDNLVYSSMAAGVINFDMPVATVSGWFTSSSNAVPSLYLEAYSGLNAMGTLLDTATINRNADSIDLMEVSGDGIWSVKIHDSGNYFTMDDFAYVVPEPATASLLAILLAGGALRLRKRKNRQD